MRSFWLHRCHEWCRLVSAKSQKSHKLPRNFSNSNKGRILYYFVLTFQMQWQHRHQRIKALYPNQNSITTYHVRLNNKTHTQFISLHCKKGFIKSLGICYLEFEVRCLPQNCCGLAQVSAWRAFAWGKSYFPSPHVGSVSFQ